MPRVKRGVTAKARHKKVLAKSKGYRGRRSNVYRIAKEAVMKAGQYQYRDRRQKKREFRALWIVSDSLQHAAKSRLRQSKAEQESSEEHDQNSKKECRRPVEIDDRHQAVARDLQTIIAAVDRKSVRYVEEHLCKGECDHDEVDTGRAERNPADDECR